MSKVKEHFERNKKLYIGVGVGVGVAGITWLLMRTRMPTALQFGPLAELPCSTKELPGSSFSNISGTVIANNTAPVIFGGYSRKIIQNMTTGQIFESVGDAAEHANVSFSMMSRHINGHMDNIYGDAYRIIGLNTFNPIAS